MFEARLSPDPWRSVVSTDQLGKLTGLYLTPHGGNRIDVYNGTAWVERRIEEGFPIGTATLGMADGNYDVFAYLDEANVVRLDVQPWPTVREFQRRDGVLLHPTDHTRMLVGSLRVEDGGYHHDSKRRHVWNYFNQVPHRLQYQLTGPVPVNTSHWRMAGNNPDSFVSVLLGGESSLVVLSGKDWVNAYPHWQVGYAGIGINSVTPHPAGFQVQGHTVGTNRDLPCYMTIAPGPGYFKFNLLERIEVAIPSTLGNQPSIMTCGLTGFVTC